MNLFFSVVTQYRICEGSVPSIRRKVKRKKAKGYWADGQHLKDFFVTYARAMQFDPFQPSNWISVTTKDVVSKQV